MGARFSDFKNHLYRTVKYKMTRPSPPTIHPGFDGPVVVVGSSPVSHCPRGFDETYRVVSINGSQAVTKNWGLSAPDVTLLQFNQISGVNTNAVNVRRVLTGERTGHLFVLLWRKNDIHGLKQGLEAFHYSYDGLTIVDRYERMALLDKVAQATTTELRADAKCSNGVNAVLFALYNGAKAVIITGIDPNSHGHAYSEADLPRHHVQMDIFVLRRLLDLGYAIFTSDPTVAIGTGLPLWSGQSCNVSDRASYLPVSRLVVEAAR